MLVLSGVMRMWNYVWTRTHDTGENKQSGQRFFFISEAKCSAQPRRCRQVDDYNNS